MTHRTCERATGYQVVDVSDPRGKAITLAAFDTASGREVIRITCSSGKPSKAYYLLAESVLGVHRGILAKRHGYRCQRCRGFKPLHAHHVVHRSKEPNHRIENLEILCVDCHRSVHEGHSHG